MRKDLWEFCMRRRAARLRFDTWVGRIMTLNAFFKRVQGDDPRKPYIGYGNAHFASSGAGERPVPVKKAAMRCITYFGRDRVVPVDEHRTSAMSYDSEQPLCKVYEVGWNKWRTAGRKGKGGKWTTGRKRKGKSGKWTAGGKRKRKRKGQAEGQEWCCRLREMPCPRPPSWRSRTMSAWLARSARCVPRLMR